MQNIVPLIVVDEAPESVTAPKETVVALEALAKIMLFATVPSHVAQQYGVEEKMPVTKVTTQEPADTFPMEDTHVPCCEVIAEPASQLSFAASMRVSPEY